MTIKLTKATRTEVLSKVLKEAFEPKFAKLQKRLVEYARKWLHDNHPVFVELLARKDAREYLHTKGFHRVRIDCVDMRRPDWGIDGTTVPIKVDEVSIPYRAHSYLEVTNVDLALTYSTLRSDYEMARAELSSVLAAYKTHEALLADFPEYAKYLPVPVVKQLPAVIPSESRAKLSALMIPVDVSIL